MTTSQVKKKGFRATQVKIEHEPEHKHRHLHHIAKMIDGSTLNTRQRELAHRIFGKLAEAEAKVHGTSIEKVHFHEVGAVDSICDIVGVAVAWDLLGIQRAVSSAIPTGTGFVEIAHGRWREVFWLGVFAFVMTTSVWVAIRRQVMRLAVTLRPRR